MPQRFVWPLFAAIMGFVFGGSVFWGFYYQPQQAQQVHAEQHTEGAIKDQREGNPNSSGREGAKANSEHGEEGTEFWPPLLGLRLKITDTLLVAFTACLFGATWLLFLATRDLVSGADETARRQLRAYVFVEKIEFNELTSEAGPITKVVLKNTGLTPAYKAEHVGVYAVCDYPLEEELLAVPRRGEAGSFFMLGPGMNTTKEGRRSPLSQETIVRLRTGTKILFLYGEVRFVDAYGTPRRLRYKAAIGGPYAAKRGLDWSITADGNETSEDAEM